ncbi:TetR/AcrR family transcriptional regulator [Streptomyces sp. NPDC048473]|uniref:TetR/AcrR family transcriptional regulator n=1 Tax=unclassified Streptomyces TaxID=2593676 RepID=UPI00371166B8
MQHTGDRRAGVGRPRRADAARNAGLLLSAAKEIFGEYGPEAAMDDVARRAGLGNATLYRHFPTRGDLLVAVYADEVDALCGQGAALLRDEPDAAEALFVWLDSFVVHVATRRALALAITEGPDVRRSELFGRWHASMTATAEKLLLRARAVDAVRPDLTANDLLALTSAAAIASTGADHAQRLLLILRSGFETSGTGSRAAHSGDFGYSGEETSGRS